MELSESVTILKDRATVWAALNDPEVLGKAIPGCQQIALETPEQMTVTLLLKVGPIKARFNGLVALSNVVAPESYVLSGEGKGGVAGFAKGGAEVRLEEAGPDATVLHYAAKADVGGKLAQLGSRLLDSTAKKLARQFFDNFNAIVSGAEPAAVTGDAEGESDAAPGAA